MPEPSAADSPEDGGETVPDHEAGAAPADEGDAAADGAGETAGSTQDEAVPERAEALAGDGETKSWYRQYAGEQFVHLLVVGFFAAYPFLYDFLVEAPGMGAEMTTLLPSVEVMIVVFYFGLFAMSFDFISGYTGYLSFGHAAFYGTGAYFVILVANDKIPMLGSGTPFMMSLLLGGVLAAVLALLIGAVSFRLSGVYFAMITLGFSQVIYVAMRNWRWVGSNPRNGTYVLNHPEGFRIGVPYVESLSLKIGRLKGDTVTDLLGTGIDLSTAEVSYFAIGVVVLLSYFAMQRIIHSPFGRVMIAIRENEERARAVGYDTFKYKMGAFAISAFFAAVAGGLLAGFTRSVAPDGSLFFLVAGDGLLAAIIGGFGTLAGPLFGWLFFETAQELLSKGVSGGLPDGLLPYLQELLGESTLSSTVSGEFTVRQFLELALNGRAGFYIGILFVLFVLFVPNGILGTLRMRLGGTIGKRFPVWVRNLPRRIRRLPQRVRGWRQ